MLIVAAQMPRPRSEAPMMLMVAAQMPRPLSEAPRMLHHAAHMQHAVLVAVELAPSSSSFVHRAAHMPRILRPRLRTKTAPPMLIVVAQMPRPQSETPRSEAPMSRPQSEAQRMLWHSLHQT